MNYLAHLFLSCQDDDLLIGNFIADSISNKEVVKYPLPIQKGIFLHRKIDSFTDAHPIVRQGTRRLHPLHHKYAPVVMDVYFDYLLVNNWGLYAKESLDDFSKKVYKLLINRKGDLPVKLRKNIQKMIESNWLMKYGTDEGLQYVFDRLDKRATFKSNFGNALSHLKKDYQLYNDEFNLFFPDVSNMVADFCVCITTSN